MNDSQNKNEKMSGKSRSLIIYGYTDYRAYLRDFYEFRKNSERSYSYRSFSKAAGFTSPNILKLVMEGKRNLGQEAVFQFIKGLGLEGPMADYFHALVKMNQAKTDQEKETWYQELKKLTPYSKRRWLDPEGHRYLSHWLYPILREMVSLEDFRDDPYWIARRLNGKVSANDIASAFQFLLAEGFIEKNTEGKYCTKDHMIISNDEVKSLAIRNYHRQMLDQAKESLENLPIEKREFAALTFILPESAIEELKFKIKSFRRELHEWAIQAMEIAKNKKDRDLEKSAVVQVNMHMYPHTKVVETKPDEEEKA